MFALNPLSPPSDCECELPTFSTPVSALMALVSEFHDADAAPTGVVVDTLPDKICDSVGCTFTFTFGLFATPAFCEN